MVFPPAEMECSECQPSNIERGNHENLLAVKPAREVIKGGVPKDVLSGAR
jgi:hypothetical protein